VSVKNRLLRDPMKGQRRHVFSCRRTVEKASKLSQPRKPKKKKKEKSWRQEGTHIVFAVTFSGEGALKQRVVVRSKRPHQPGVLSAREEQRNRHQSGGAGDFT